MRKLRRPTETAQDTFLTCISRVRKRTLKIRLNFIEPIVTNTDADYQRRIVRNTLHQIASGSTCFGGTVTTEEMVSVYTGRMVPKTSPGRHIYDKLLSAAPNGKCPLCSIGAVSTLDHLLPKTEYPALTVAPLNLVPSCKDCNTAKLTAIPTVPSEIFLHPYYDDVESDTWLVASVSQPLAVTYDVLCPQGWPQILQDRVKHHFDKLGLAKLFGSNAASQLAVLSKILEPLYVAGGAAEVTRYLLGEVTGYRAVHLNSWQTAMYEAVANDNWYISGGFRS